MNLRPGQMVALGIGIVFGIPILATIILAHFFDFWTGAVVGVSIFVIIVAIGQRNMKKQVKQQKKELK